jgi:NitT/TauT family transport system substrate-binding protein
MRTRTTTAALAAIGLLSLTACGGGDTEAGGTDGGTTELTFLFPTGSVIQYHPWYIAEEKGWFEEEGVSVELQVGDGSSGIIQQVLAGNADAALPAPSAFLTAVDGGQDLRWVYQYQYSNIFSLATPEDSGIDDAAGLKGGAVGVSDLSGGEVPLIRAVLREAGLEEGTDVQILEVGEGSALAVENLNNGRVQAYSSNLFDISTIEANGVPMQNILPEDVQSFPANGVVVPADALEEKEESLTAMLRAVVRAVQWSLENPDEAKELAAEIAPEEFEDDAIADAAWEAATQLKTPPSDVDGELLGTPVRSGWDLYYEFLQEGTEEEGAVSGDVELDTVLDLSLLEAANEVDAPSTQEG